MIRFVPLAAALCAASAAHADDGVVYQATLTGAFTSVDFDTVDPGSLGALGAGDTYSLVITADPTPAPDRSAGAQYDILGVEFFINDEGGAIPISTPGLSRLYVQTGAGYAYLGFDLGVDALPFDTVRLAMLDNDGDPALSSGDLPLALDLGSFTNQRELSLLGVLDTDEQSLYPSASATIDSVSAKYIPGPATALALPFALAARRRRR